MAGLTFTVTSKSNTDGKMVIELDIVNSDTPKNSGSPPVDLAAPVVIDDSLDGAVGPLSSLSADIDDDTAASSGGVVISSPTTGAVPTHEWWYWYDDKLLPSQDDILPDGSCGRARGWHPYAPYAHVTMDRLWVQFLKHGEQANNIRVKSGVHEYTVTFTQEYSKAYLGLSPEVTYCGEQRNVKYGTERPIGQVPVVPLL